MQFLVSSSLLLKQLQSISGVLTSNNSLAILDNFLFQINDGQLEVSASDLETTMKTTLDVSSEASINLCVPAKMILDILKNIPDQQITFVVQEDFHFSISYTNGKSKMQGFNGDEFPKLPEVQNTTSITFNGDMISSAISKTLFAAGNDDLRPVMSGVFCQLSTDDIIFVATDAHKLVRYKRTDSKATGTSSFILPKKALNLVKSTVGENDKVKLDYNDSNAIFYFANKVVTCRLIDGKYPNYEAVIPNENPNVLTIDRLSFLSSLKRVSIFSNKTTHQVKLKISGSELSISAEDLDFSNAANERLTCSYEGEDIEIGFNSRFLMEMLNNLDSDEIQLLMSQPNRAGIIVPTSLAHDSENILMLVMPVVLNR